MATASASARAAKASCSHNIATTRWATSRERSSSSGAVQSPGTKYRPRRMTVRSVARPAALSQSSATLKASRVAALMLLATAAKAKSPCARSPPAMVLPVHSQTPSRSKASRSTRCTEK